MKISELLPIGTVVQLYNGEHYLMITGVMQTTVDGMNYDYCAVPYPEGSTESNLLKVFDHDKIQKVLFRGWEEERRKQFIAQLEAFYANEEEARQELEKEQ